jgi:hypothetical protein
VRRRREMRDKEEVSRDIYMYDWMLCRESEPCCKVMPDESIVWECKYYMKESKTCNYEYVEERSRKEG